MKNPFEYTEPRPVNNALEAEAGQRLNDALLVTGASLDLIETSIKRGIDPSAYGEPESQQLVISFAKTADEHAEQFHLKPDKRLRLLHNAAVVAVHEKDTENAKHFVERFNGLLELLAPDDPHTMSVENIQLYLNDLRPKSKLKKLWRKLGHAAFDYDDHGFRL